MPTYEYRCTRCNHTFEAVHAVGETVDRCEHCGGPVRRLFSPPALIFKGSGFHITDYRKTPPPADADGKKTPEAKPAGETKSGDAGGTGTATSSTSETKKAS